MNHLENCCTSESFEVYWSPDFELGHPAIDAQHKKLFQLYNELVKSFFEPMHTANINTVLMELLEYTRYHFREEETVMSRNAFSDLKEHQKQHQALLSEVECLWNDVENDKPVLTYEVLHFLRGWLSDHILEEDMKLKTILPTMLK